MAGAAAGAEPGDDRQRDVLGRNREPQRARHAHFHRLGLAQQQRLGGEDMFDFGRADAERQRPEGAMGRGVAVAADHGHARQGKALFRADDMDDALFGGIDGEHLHPEIAAIHRQRIELRLRHRIEDRQPAIGRRHVVIGHRQRQVGAAQATTGEAQAFERLWRRHFVDEVAIDEDQRGAVIEATDDMIVPDLGVKRAGGAHACLLPRNAAGIQPVCDGCPAGGMDAAVTPLQSFRP